MNSAANAQRWQQQLIRCAVIVVLAIAVRLPGLNGQFLWDDDSLIRDNPFIKSPLLFVESFRHPLALDGSSGHYRPLQTISYFYDYFFWNLDPLGYHLTNVLLHALAGLLLFALLIQLMRPLLQRDSGATDGNRIETTAFVVALIWVVHPVHSAAVDYISGRADSLAFVFAAAAWLLFLRGAPAISGWAKAALAFASATMALLSLCSRETGCVWILLFLLHLLLFEQAITKWMRAAAIAGCAVLIALYAALRHLPHEHLIAVPAAVESMQMRSVLILRALGDYVRLIAWPSNLHVERSVRPMVGGGNFIAATWLTWFGAAVAAALGYVAWRKGLARRLRIFGTAWFAIAFLPVSNLIPLNATVAEHWMYIPSIGLLLVLAGIWCELPRSIRQPIAALAVLAVAALSARSFVRSGDWIDSETFYRNSLSAGAAKPRMTLNLAQVLAAQQRYAEAETLLRTLVAENPNYAMANNALAHLLLQTGHAEQSRKMFVGAARSSDANPAQPRTWIAALNLAYMKFAAHDFAAAHLILQHARENYPNTWRLVALDAEVLEAESRRGEAQLLLRSFSDANWWHTGALIAIARLSIEERDFGAADRMLRRAAALDVHGVEALNLIAQANLAQNELAAAYAAQRSAVNRQPKEPLQFFLLADILKRIGRNDEAAVASAECRRLQSLGHAPAARPL